MNNIDFLTRLSNESEHWDDVALKLSNQNLFPDLRISNQIKIANEKLYHNPSLLKLLYRPFLKYLKNELKPSSRILEIGCGNGKISLELARMGHSVTGVDLSKVSIEIAQKYYDSIRLKENIDGSIEYYCKDFGELVISQKFDYIISMNVLHHLHSLDKDLVKLHNSLEKNGKIIAVESFSGKTNINRKIIQIVFSLILPKKKLHQVKQLAPIEASHENFEQHNDYNTIQKELDKIFSLEKTSNLFSFSSPVSRQLPYEPDWIRKIVPKFLLFIDRILMNCKIIKSEVKFLIFYRD